jgi:hypothetical protein
MDTVHTLLRRLRFWFLVWFAAEAVIGMAVAAYVLDGMSRRHSLLRYVTGGVGAAGTILAGVAVSLILLLLALALLKALLDLRPWARMVMLVIGWIKVASAALNLLTLPGASALLDPVVMLTGGGWPALVTVSVLTNAADLAFWSWAIYVLQMNAAVREAFACRIPPPEPAPTWPAKR